MPEDPGSYETKRKALLEKTWFSFGLDDTLHEFRKAPSAAVLTTLTQISAKHQIPLTDLQNSHKKILALKKAQAFSDSRTSDEYRKERFAAVLDKFAIPITPKMLGDLAGIYKETLEKSLELKLGVKSLFAYLRLMGKKIAAITEGPQDAQVWTVEKLGFAFLVDFLATTNFFWYFKDG
ncbi:hypothetical protein G7Y89_g6138 [Cudoniella acicularis]|uniref:Uncharacterized protein n=1 Tax=Cudoniella acicularis TaxID=354080 RepID=A0A8H4RNC8_9HELO|nr:hypothetical protein G7Y89_g6138 [Cudoniella acicularis]